VAGPKKFPRARPIPAAAAFIPLSGFPSHLTGTEERESNIAAIPPVGLEPGLPRIAPAPGLRAREKPSVSSRRPLPQKGPVR